MARKPLSKRVRFEVFKRDQFKCQYCGGAAPDVLLTIDHVQPQSKGGANDILNLVTACSGCNSGKSAISLSDDSAVKKQRAQMKLLAEKREQLRMLVQWRDGLADLDNEQVTILTNKVNERLTAYEQHLNPSGIEMVRAWLKRFGFSAALHGIHQATASGVDALIGQMEQYAAAARKVEREPQLRDYWRRTHRTVDDEDALPEQGSQFGRALGGDGNVSHKLLVYQRLLPRVNPGSTVPP